MDLSTLAIYDHHAHPPRRWAAGLTVAQLRACLALGSEMAQHAPQTIFYRRALRDLAELYGCDASEEAVVAARGALGLPAIVRRALGEANLAAALLDDGYRVDDAVPIDELRPLVAPCKLGRILRVEALAEHLMSEHGENFAAFDAAYRDALGDLRRKGVVALKSIAAYRCGLRLAGDVRTHFAATAYEDEQLAARSQGQRLTSLVLISYLVSVALDEAARQELPFQFHTGIGDEDIDLRTASPLHMRDLFADARWRAVPFVLLHSYPSVRDVAYMARVFPNVYMDLSLATLFAAHGGATIWREALELAPATKLLYGSDAYALPELFYLGARHGRAAVGAALGGLVGEGWLTPEEASRFAEQILRENASRLYGAA